MAADNMARATMTRRKSSESCPEALMNAATSQADNRTRVSCTVTVIIERPRTGGVGIYCCQIFFSIFFKISAARGGAFYFGGGVCSFDADGFLGGVSSFLGFYEW